MSVEFDITSEIRGNNLLLKTFGYINNAGGERIISEFYKYPIGGLDKIVIDLENSKVINSIGISYLIEMIETITSNNCKLFFTNIDPTIEKTFKIMGIFQFAGKAESAEAVLANS